MTRVPSRSSLWFEQAGALLALAFVVAYTYALFFERPYLGFLWDTASGRVLRVYQGTELQPGDRVIQIGSLITDDLSRDLRSPTLDGEPGDVLPLVVHRGAQRLTLDWPLPAFNQAELEGRLGNQWLLAAAFWIVGELTLLLVRPRDRRWRLLCAFDMVTAVWLAASINSTVHLWQSAIILRMAIWLAVPVYWHLHWAFPQPLGRLPAFAWPALYALAGLLAVAEWFQRLPQQLYALGLVLALAGTLLLLGVRFFLRQPQRRVVWWLVAAGALAFLPSIGLGLVASQGTISMGALASMVFLPGLPLGYFFAAYRRQLGGLELRANRIVALYLFVAIVATGVVVLSAGLSAWLTFPGASYVIGFGVGLLATAVTALGFERFQRLVERRLLGIPVAPAHLVETYSARINASLGRESLARLLRDEVCPSLLVRQSALLLCDEGQITPLYTQAVEAADLPSDRDLPGLLAEAGKYRVPADGRPRPGSWALLILPLSIEGRVMGLWLLGRRDPDDFYSVREIPTLQTLAHQTAVALTNILYAERLHALYQTSIDQREAERASLGRDLHDRILRQLSGLKASAAGSLDSPEFNRNYEALVNEMYQMIRGLRPPMLEYGLYRAFVALVDDWTHRPDAQGGPAIMLDVPETDVRYAPYAEQHLYRIVQQAGENALRHARARNVKIHGRLEAGRVALAVEDDGQGFDPKRLDLAQPEARSHFGLIGMQERAALIQAQVRFETAPGRGTCVRVTWQPDGRPASPEEQRADFP